MKVNVLVSVGVGDNEEKGGSKGKKSKEPLARLPGPLLVPPAQWSHFQAPPEGAEIELWSGELSVLTISQTPGAS